MKNEIKIVIEIPEKTNAHIRSDYGHGILALRHEDMEILCYSVYHGIPYNERPHGEWIFYANYGYGDIYKCSRCSWLKEDFKPSFCENCGADMRKMVLDQGIDGAGKDGNVKEGGEK